MRDYVIMAATTCDLSDKIADEIGVVLLPMGVTLGQRFFTHYADTREMPIEEFFDRTDKGETASTTQITVETFLEEFDKVVSAGSDVIYLSLSSNLSTTALSAQKAADMTMEKNPGCKVYAVDTLGASMGEGLMVYLAAQKKRQGADIDQVREYIEEIKFKLCHWFTVDSLAHLRRGGRLSPGAAIVGTMLGIKPVLHVDDEGRLIPMEKVRGRKQSVAALFRHMEESAVDYDGQTVFICHADCLDDAKILADMIKAKYNVKRIVINIMGPIIGTHVGKGTLALFFLGDKR